MMIVRKNPKIVIPVPPEAGGIQVNKSGSKRTNNPSASVRIRLHLVFLGLALVLLTSTTLRASEVFILQSSNLEVYSEVVAGVQEVYPQAKVACLPGDPAKNDALIEQLRHFQPSAILAIGAPAASTLREKIKDIPIVYCMISDPGRYDLSGNNISGVSLKIRTQEQLQLFKKALPAIRRIGVLCDPGVSGQTIAEARTAAKDLNLLLIEKTVTRQTEIADSLNEIIWGVDALWMIPDPTVVSKESFQYLLEASISRRLPLFTFSDVFVKRGALLALAPDYPSIGRQAGQLIQKILQGQSPGGIPLVYAQGSLVINRHTAQTLNIPLASDLFKTAAKVY
ncbi:MAG: ABC transporter substrate-binding protein [bacterium]|nr:ABC transporter substrate-binding protein [bacterium]